MKRLVSREGFRAFLALTLACLLACAGVAGASGVDENWVEIGMTQPNGDPLSDRRLVVEDETGYACMLKLSLHSTRIGAYTVRLLADDAFVPFIADGQEMDRLTCVLEDGHYGETFEVVMPSPDAPGTRQMAWVVMGDVDPAHVPSLQLGNVYAPRFTLTRAGTEGQPVFAEGAALPAPPEVELFFGLNVLDAADPEQAPVYVEPGTETLMVCLRNNSGEACVYRVLCVMDGEIVAMDGAGSLTATVPAQSGVYWTVPAPEGGVPGQSRMFFLAMPDAYNDMSGQQAQEAIAKRNGTEPQVSQVMVWTE